MGHPVARGYRPLDWSRAMSQQPSIADRYREARERGATLVGGHRGNPAECPENTLTSFRSAIELGVDLIECDVHLSRDGELVVIHDHTLDRTTSGSGPVFQLTVEDLRKLDAGQGERIPLLSDVCELARGRVGLCVELKQLPMPYPGIEEKLVAALRELDMIEQSCVISFDHRSVLRVKSVEARLQTGVLLASHPIDPVGVLREAGADIYSPHWGTMDPELVQDLHAAGGVVGAWTVDDEAGLAWCRRCRPDSVFTNRPREVLPVLRASTG